MCPFGCETMVSQEAHQGITSQRGHKSSCREAACVPHGAHQSSAGRSTTCLRTTRRVVQRRTPPSTFPEGSWEQLDEVDLTDFFLLRQPMLKSCPHFMRVRFRQSFGAVLAERQRAKSVGDELGESRAWKLFDLVPMTLLHRPRCAGSIGRDELARRADQFAAGRWTELINQARQTATRISRDEAEDQRRRIQHGKSQGRGTR